MSTLVSTNPHDGSAVGSVPVASREDVRDAVARAHAAQPAWAALSFDERVALFLNAREPLRQAAEELGSLIHREMGKPLDEALGEARGVADAMDRQVELARKAVEPQVFREGALETAVRHDPLGVVAVITPWNFPLWMPLSLMFPALLVGNAVVHKPSEKTPLTGKRFTEIVAAALPAGVLQHLSGAGDVGRALVEADVQMVAFVGSQEVGREVMASCARGLKRLVLELGGKDPMLVLDDADLDAAAKFAARGAFRNAGQVCCSVERILVHRAVADRFVEKLVEAARGTSIGPLVDEEQRRAVARQVDDAAAKGARVLLGGAPASGPGSFYPPTVVVGITDEMEIARRETFGPVAQVRIVQDEDDAVRVANDTEYGLGATVWSGDAARAERVAARLQAGMIGVNRGIGSVGDAPWVGARQSGFGYTQNVEGTRHFTQVRSITREVG